jgi:stringent starvation protein B
VLNIGFGATSGLKMDNDAVRFHAPASGGVSRENLMRST